VRATGCVGAGSAASVHSAALLVLLLDPLSDVELEELEDEDELELELLLELLLPLLLPYPSEYQPPPFRMKLPLTI